MESLRAGAEEIVRDGTQEKVDICFDGMGLVGLSYVKVSEEMSRKLRVSEMIYKRQSKKVAERDRFTIKGSKDDDYDLEKHLEELEGTNQKPIVKKAKNKKKETKQCYSLPQDPITSNKLAAGVHFDKNNSQKEKKREDMNLNKTEEPKGEYHGLSKQENDSHMNKEKKLKKHIEEERLKKVISDKQVLILQQKENLKNAIESKHKEMAELVVNIDATKEEKSEMMNKVSDIDEKMRKMQQSKDEMIHMCKEQEKIENKLLLKKERLQNSSQQAYIMLNKVLLN